MQDRVISLYVSIIQRVKESRLCGKAAEILMKYRDGKTPVGIVRHAGREEESSYITTLDAVKDAPIDMFSIVIVGNSNTYSTRWKDDHTKRNMKINTDSRNVE